MGSLSAMKPHLIKDMYGMNDMARKLKEPKKLRSVTPRCCATCKHRIDVASGKNSHIDYPECERGDVDMNGEEMYFQICEHYKAQ